MKVHEIFESNIVDISSARTRRDLERRVRELNKHEDIEHAAMNDFVAVENWITEFKEKSNVPGFHDLNSLMAYIVADLKLPQWYTMNKRSARQWFKSLSAKQQDHARMIAHHAPRLIKRYETILHNLFALKQKWGKVVASLNDQQLDALDYADYLFSETEGDIEILNNLIKAVNLQQ